MICCARALDYSLQTVADRDPGAALVRCDQQQDAIVLPRLADPPVIGERVGIVLDGPPGEGGNRRDDELIGRAVLGAASRSVSAPPRPASNSPGRPRGR